MKDYYYPRIDKERVFELGYIAERSGHSRGSTVDVTLIPLGQMIKPITPKTRILADGVTIFYLEDGSVDMGTSFDFCDAASHHETDLLEAPYKERREHLKELMIQVGFKPYAKEWWHYTLENEPYPTTYFDFAVE